MPVAGNAFLTRDLDLCFSLSLESAPFSLRQPHSGTSSSVSYSLIPSPITSSSSDSPLFTSITPSLFHSRLKTYLFHKSYPPQARGLTACTPGWAPGPTLGDEYGKPFITTHLLTTHTHGSRHTVWYAVVVVSIRNASVKNSCSSNHFPRKALFTVFTYIFVTLWYNVSHRSSVPAADHVSSPVGLLSDQFCNHKGWHKTRFCCFCQQNPTSVKKVWCKVSLCENFQKYSRSYIIPPSNGP